MAECADERKDDVQGSLLCEMRLLTLLLLALAAAALPATAHAAGVPTRQGHLVRQSGPVALDLWSADWIVEAGHRIAVKVADANADWWIHVPTKQTVTVTGGSVSLPFLPAARETGTIAGQAGTQLASYLEDTVTVPQGTIDQAETPGFATP